jgi:hypothetical protein
VACKEGINNRGRYVIRPMSLEMDRKHECPEPFLRNFMKLASGFRSSDVAEAFGDQPSAEKRDPSKPSETNRNDRPASSVDTSRNGPTSGTLA